MVESKVYFQPRDYVLGAINDIKELQNGRGTPSDIDNGKINFMVRLYRAKWEFRFTVTDIGKNRCNVEIEINGDVQNMEEKILREYALLDSMLAEIANVEFVEKEGTGSV